MSRRRGSLLASFTYAFDGIVHALRHERNMWIHFITAGLVLVAALFFALTRLEVIALFVAISFVLITEMFNTAVEHVVDLVTDEEDPRARIAKDVSAGAVLLAAVNAVAVAYLVFYDKITSVPYTVLSKLRGSPIDVTVIALFIVILVAVAVKAVTGRGTAVHGGMPAVHAAVGLCIAGEAFRPEQHRAGDRLLEDAGGMSFRRQRADAADVDCVDARHRICFNAAWCRPASASSPKACQRASSIRVSTSISMPSP